MVAGSLGRARVELSERLRVRRGEIEQVVLTRVHSVSNAREIADREYVDGLRVAVSSALDYGLTAVERGQERMPLVPATLLVQARLAARNGIGLDTVLRRYIAGSTVLSDFIMQEAETTDALGVDAVHRVGRDQAALLDHLLAAITEEYTQASEARLGSSEERRAERIRRLLVGELLDTSDFAYDFGGWHLGALANGPASVELLRTLAGELDRRLLLIRGEEAVVWAWLGGRQPTSVDDALSLPAKDASPGTALAFGEPARGLTGWRLTHRQASAALSIALRDGKPVVRYAEVALLASVLQDDLLTTSLGQLYLAPLSSERDGGEVMKETLRAFFAAERNVSSAAVALGVKRHTVTNRLRAIEGHLRRPLGDCATELEMALRLEVLGGFAPGEPRG